MSIVFRNKLLFLPVFVSLYSFLSIFLCVSLQGNEVIDFSKQIKSFEKKYIKDAEKESFFRKINIFFSSSARDRLFNYPLHKIKEKMPAFNTVTAVLGSVVLGRLFQKITYENRVLKIPGMGRSFEIEKNGQNEVLRLKVNYKTIELKRSNDIGEHPKTLVYLSDNDHKYNLLIHKNGENYYSKNVYENDYVVFGNDTDERNCRCILMIRRGKLCAIQVDDPYKNIFEIKVGKKYQDNFENFFDDDGMQEKSIYIDNYGVSAKITDSMKALGKGVKGVVADIMRFGRSTWKNKERIMKAGVVFGVVAMYFSMRDNEGFAKYKYAKDIKVISNKVEKIAQKIDIKNMTNELLNQIFKDPSFNNFYESEKSKSNKKNYVFDEYDQSVDLFINSNRSDATDKNLLDWQVGNDPIEKEHLKKVLFLRSYVQGTLPEISDNIHELQNEEKEKIKDRLEKILSEENRHLASSIMKNIFERYNDSFVSTDSKFLGDLYSNLFKETENESKKEGRKRLIRAIHSIDKNIPLHSFVKVNKNYKNKLNNNSTDLNFSEYFDYLKKNTAYQEYLESYLANALLEINESVGVNQTHKNYFEDTFSKKYPLSSIDLKL